MLKDFKAFVLRGNVVDLAVGIVIGAAFGTLVSSLVKNILTPLLAIPGTVNFDDLQVQVGGGDIRYGLFLNAARVTWSTMDQRGRNRWLVRRHRG